MRMGMGMRMTMRMEMEVRIGIGMEMEMGMGWPTSGAGATVPLQDILENESINLDWMFRYSLINDIVKVPEQGAQLT